MDVERGAFERARSRLSAPDQTAAAAVRARHDRLTKPRGSLGRLEELGAQLAAIASSSPPPVPEPATVVVFAADHGVHAEGVTPWPVEVTAQMVENFCAGGAAINVLGRQLGAQVRVVDVGVASELGPRPGLVRAKVRAGSANIAVEPAMSDAEAAEALDVGASMARLAVEEGARCLVTGDMGIGNTTASAALIASYTGKPAESVTGRGTGIDDERLAAKVATVERALGRAAAGAGGLGTLSSLGGLEIAALAGFVVGAAGARVPVLLDGVIALAATLAAASMAPDCVGYCVAGHRSTEPGASVALEHLGLTPVLDLEMRLGEGSGACLALPVVQAAARVVSEMATFDAAGVVDKNG